MYGSVKRRWVRLGPTGDAMARPNRADGDGLEQYNSGHFGEMWSRCVLSHTGHRLVIHRGSGLQVLPPPFPSLSQGSRGRCDMLVVFSTHGILRTWAERTPAVGGHGGTKPPPQVHNGQLDTVSVSQ